MARDRKKYNDPSINHVDTETWDKIKQRLTTVKILCSDGATNAQIADYLGVSIYTIVTYRQRYPEFNECFTIGRQEVIDKLEGKMFSLAMGAVNKNVVRTVTKEVIDEVEDPDTGEISEVVTKRKTRTNIQEDGYGEPSETAIQFMLRNLAPEKYNVQPTNKDGELEPIHIVDDIPTTITTNDTPTLLYDDTQDSKDSEE